MKLTEWPQFQLEIFRNIKNLPQAQLVGLRIFSCLAVEEKVSKTKGSDTLVLSLRQTHAKKQVSR